ncbi:MAG: hypothetical protein K2Y25_03245 [Pseudomonadaceae bacterium]|jgi:hypothetical protein|nr:hypothetical protein [Pseudomonadaceae bacterium]
MHDPLARGSSRAPATLGEGCISRYDPDALSADNGTEFADAAALWRQLQAAPLVQADIEPVGAALRPEPLPAR